jgi:ComF family protein
MTTGALTPSRALRAWIQGSLDVLYPPACLACQGRLAPEDRIVCARCLATMRLDRAWHCPRCGARGLGVAPEAGRRCRLCPPEKASWRGAVSASGYGPAASACVHAFKYGRRREAGQAMARLMRRELGEALRPLRDRLAVVAPVPIHWRRRFWRGFNQSDLLAEALAEELGLPCRLNLLRRVRHTCRQALLPRERRAENVRGAFALGDVASAGLDGVGVLLVDDVVTTGNTIEACARALLDAGAREAWVACFARAGAGGPPTSEEEWLVASGPGMEP